MRRARRADERGRNEPLTIRHGWVVMTGDMSPLIYAKPDILRHYGKSYTVDAVHFAGTSPQLVALATDQIEVASLAYSSFANGIENGHLDDMRIIADGFQDGAKGYASIQYMVKNGSPYKRVEDLKGKVLGVNVIGAAVDIGARAVLAQHGLTAIATTRSSRRRSRRSARCCLRARPMSCRWCRPSSMRPRCRPARTAFTMKDGMGTSQMIVLVARKEFLAQHRAALDDFFEDMVRGIHWMLTPANRQAAIQFAASVAKAAIAARAPFLTKKDYRDPDGIPDLAALQRNIETQVSSAS